MTNLRINQKFGKVPVEVVGIWVGNFAQPGGARPAQVLITLNGLPAQSALVFFACTLSFGRFLGLCHGRLG